MYNNMEYSFVTEIDLIYFDIIKLLQKPDGEHTLSMRQIHRLVLVFPHNDNAAMANGWNHFYNTFAIMRNSRHTHRVRPKRAWICKSAETCQ